ncbi:MAG: 30S ribosomal protein S6 [Clostridiales bacterium]|jgi:small subunit ribosomal protein S6|nr:30S ribosomal protein S6 [Clostridiales bacterium]
MNKYELGVVIMPGLEDDVYKAEMERVQSLIARFEGTIDKVDEWGRRKLAYPINKISEGIYTFITFTATPSAPKEIEDRLRIMENVLRFLIIRLDD